MIDTWIITGDTHGDMSRFDNLNDYGSSSVGIIILGDAGCNYYLNKKDTQTKLILENTRYSYFLVRGNHEERPENISTYKEIDMFGGKVFVEKEHEIYKK